MKTRCIIIDDDPLAITVLESYLEKVDKIDIIAKYNNAIDAYDILRKEKIDLIFLDIEMPRLTGVDFIKTLNEPPSIIITSANKDYAIDGFELNVIDYLMKPITFGRFLKAVNKFFLFHQSVSDINKLTEEKNENFLFVKENKKMVKVLFKDILYIESIKDYVKIATISKSVITKEQISAFENKLDKKDFIRIHRSYIVSINKIEAFSATTIEIGNKELPIGRSYKNSVMEKLS
ncbi:MAG: response regulator transcription factor [Bacteroidales bacterium]|nr:response regulator transcription factor [Bacteroidales bacterium]